MAKILILGGTGFVGRILSEKLADSGHELTLFNRGKRNPGIIPKVRRITGDRNTDDIKKIGDEDWDVVFDFSGFLPPNIEKIASLLKGKANRYVFVSSCSVYFFEDYERIKYPVTEDNEVLTWTREQKENPDPYTFYGEKKAACERVLLDREWMDVIIFRPALIYGRYDPTDRFYYWLYRVQKFDRILIPDGGKFRLSNTYCEDFADVLHAAVSIKGHKKIYNITTHAHDSIREIVDLASNYLNRTPELIDAPAEFLKKHEVAEWSDLPMWLNGQDMIIDSSRVKKDFVPSFHSFDESVKETIDYYSSLGFPECKAGINRNREEELIELL